MTTMKAKYLGGLRVECEHVQSGSRIITDAPIDNCGKGEAFSPTDLCATAWGACILTTMGIYAEQHGMDLTGAGMEIVKRMGTDPRRIVEIDIVVNMPACNFSEKEKKILERVAHTCPVHFSLNEQMIKTVKFNWL